MSVQVRQRKVHGLSEEFLAEALHDSQAEFCGSQSLQQLQPLAHACNQHQRKQGGGEAPRG